MQRRDFIALLGGVFSWPSAAHAQQKAMAVIGLLGIGSPPPSSLMAAFGQGLNETGYVEGQKWRSNTASRSPTMIGCLHSPPISSAARSI